MICKECKNKPIARGIKHIVCFLCSKETLVNSSYVNICVNCSDDLLICQCCGEKIKVEIQKETNYYALSWLEIAVKNFKNQNEKVHAINGNMTMDDFIKIFAKDELSKIVKL